MTKASSTPRFDYHEALCRADAVLSDPPAKGATHRPELLPTRVFRAALPSELCLAMNRWKRTSRFSESALKENIWSFLEPQALRWRQKLGHLWPFDEMFEDRPQVIAIKFSSHAPDVGANFGKMAIDMLTRPTLKRPHHRIGIIVDDRPTRVDQLHWWEFIPQKYAAFVIIEVRV